MTATSNPLLPSSSAQKNPFLNPTAPPTANVFSSFTASPPKPAAVEKTEEPKVEIIEMQRDDSMTFNDVAPKNTTTEPPKTLFGS